MMMMGFDLLFQLRRLTHLPTVSIDDWFFRCHYWITSTGLLAASAIAFAKQYFGDPIECIFDAKDGTEIKAVDAYCWLHSTFNLDSSLWKKINDNPKIRNPCKGFFKDENIAETDTFYYQWVPFFILLQALTFRVSWKLWNVFEGGRMSEFSQDGKRHLILEEQSDSLARHNVNLFRSIFRQNNGYVYKYIFCELLNLIVVTFNFFLTNLFLGGNFTSYGLDVLYFYRLSSSDRRYISNPVCALFPTVTSCQFPSGALTGNLNVDHALCILSLNIINDKIFLLEWFWFLFLGILSLISFFLRLLSLMSVKYRRFSFLRKIHDEKEMRMYCNVFEKLKYGDWFFLHQLEVNIHSHTFKRFIIYFSTSLSDSKSPSEEDTYKRS